jgi:putative YpdA family bacillithiol system oxidoreductase
VSGILRRGGGGRGTNGLACGIELQQRGLKTVLVEKGCVVNSIYHYPTNMSFFTTPELLEIGNIPMTSLNDKPNRTEALKYYRRVAEHFRLEIRQYERVDRIAGGDGAFQVFTTDRLGCPSRVRARKIVLATGYYDVPNMLDVPGEELDKVLHYYKGGASLLQPRCGGDRSQELGGHRGAGTVVDRRARDADSSRRGHLGFGEVLDQTEHRKPH